MPRSPATKTTVKHAHRASPRLPHERDESVDAQQASPDRIADKAFEDAASGKADTSLGPVTDRTYRKLRGGGPGR